MIVFNKNELCEIIDFYKNGLMELRNLEHQISSVEKEKEKYKSNFHSDNDTFFRTLKKEKATLEI